jgi:ABC-2 type transport system ATP-binding protein
VGDGVITVDQMTKRFGRGGASVTAVDGLTVAVQPGRVTGFLGPNGAGKTTTLRCLLGLVRPSSGTALFDGQRYEDLRAPVQTGGAVLEATGFYPSRRARDHVGVVAAAAGIGGQRVEEVLALVGLADAAGRRVGEYSLGMRQRLMLAVALLGDPQYLILDEPANGLDPQGITWLRGFLRYLAGQGRTILVSSHVLAEVQQTADDVIIIHRGKLVAARSLADMEADRLSPQVDVVTPDPEALIAALAEHAPSATVQREGEQLRVGGGTAAQVGAIAFRAGVELHGLTQRSVDLEQMFLELTSGTGQEQP